MKLSTAVSLLAFASGSIAYAGECSTKQLRKYDSKLTAACGSDIQGLYASTGTTSIALCKETKCVEAIDSIADDLPDCTLGGLSLPNMFDAIVQYCKAEGNSSHSGSVAIEKPECSLSQQNKMTDMRSEPAMTKVCGPYEAMGGSKAIAKICEPDCTAYIKEKYIPALPDCSVNGAGVRVSAKIMLTYCELPPDAAGALTSAGVAALASLAVAMLAMA
ncbi:hypothetical protein Poli38472_006493 [Pythium oligandrum]|uniref:Elicitin-like protein n=1 Tax=Pythium oligandrum TaxID=41045 RepID=A0A8K1C551_PYTOL|nr:hypothetical protein Poli38472_006493 [Pythium oligandrum]|eukprot:TMW56483.1 hypothetical protein Poli38472_006493 [Pythium oligandrum]